MLLRWFIATMLLVDAESIPYEGISTGKTHMCGVTTKGMGHCWGFKDTYTYVDNLGPTDMKNVGEEWALLSAGHGFTCGVTIRGSGHCWGYGEYGQTSIPAGKAWTLVSAGYDHACGVTTDKEGYCWGDDMSGKATVPLGKQWRSISTGSHHSCGVTVDGEGLCWGYTYKAYKDPTVVPSGYTWKAIDVGFGFQSCGITVDGIGMCWGDDYEGKTNVPTGHSWTSLSSGTDHVCGVTSNGNGLCWGYDMNGNTVVPAGKTWASISAGQGLTCGVTDEGDGHCWGSAPFVGAVGAPTVPSLPSGEKWATTSSLMNGSPASGPSVSGIHLQASNAKLIFGANNECSIEYRPGPPPALVSNCDIVQPSQ